MCQVDTINLWEVNSSLWEAQAEVMVNSSGQPLHDALSLYSQLMFSASGQLPAGAPPL